MSEEGNTAYEQVAEWDASQGANPDTCLHFLSRTIAYKPGQYIQVCFSCSATLSSEYMREFDWTYDGEHDVWRRKSIRDMRRERRNRTYEFEIIVADWPRVIKLEDKYFEEDYAIDYGIARWTQIYPDQLEQYLRSRGVR
jgi:hypothetical protein